MVGLHIGLVRNYRLILKFERFFHLLIRFFGLHFFIGLRHLSSIRSLRVELKYNEKMLLDVLRKDPK